HHDARAGARQREGARSADATTRAGDERGRARQRQLAGVSHSSSAKLGVSVPNSRRTPLPTSSGVQTLCLLRTCPRRQPSYTDNVPPAPPNVWPVTPWASSLASHTPPGATRSGSLGSNSPGRTSRKRLRLDDRRVRPPGEIALHVTPHGSASSATTRVN